MSGSEATSLLSLLCLSSLPDSCLLTIRVIIFKVHWETVGSAPLLKLLSLNSSFAIIGNVHFMPCKIIFEDSRV